MSEEKKYFTLEEVAELLSVNYQLIYKLVRSGELPAIRLGRIYRVSKQDLDAYLGQAKSGKTAAGTCGACGRTYASRLSLKNHCPVTGEPICLDCFERKGIRQLPEPPPPNAD